MNITTLLEAIHVLHALPDSEKEKLALLKAFEAFNILFMAMLRHQDALRGNVVAAENIRFLRTLSFSGKASIHHWTLQVAPDTQALLLYGLKQFETWRASGMDENHDFFRLHKEMLNTLPCIKFFDKAVEMEYFTQRFPDHFVNPARMSLTPITDY